MIPAIAWFAAGAVIIGLELFLPGFVAFWIGASALITSLLSLSLVFDSLISQLTFFGVMSLVMLVIWFLFLKKHFPSLSRSGMRSPVLYGIRGIAINNIGPGITGDVDLYESFHGITRWRAESFADIEPGEKVVVVEARGFKIVVKKDQRQEMPQ